MDETPFEKEVCACLIVLSTGFRHNELVEKSKGGFRVPVNVKARNNKEFTSFSAFYLSISFQKPLYSQGQSNCDQTYWDEYYARKNKN